MHHGEAKQRRVKFLYQARKAIKPGLRSVNQQSLGSEALASKHLRLQF